MAYTEIPIIDTNITIIGGRIGENEDIVYQYQKVLDDFINAEKIRIATYNFSNSLDAARDDRYRILFDRIVHTAALDVKIIIGVPGIRQHINNDEGWMRRLYESLKQLQYCYSYGSVRINVFNHSKIVGTENKVYIGSQNFSVKSYSNYESGVVFEDENIAKAIYDNIFSKLWEKSIPIEEVLLGNVLLTMPLLEQLKYCQGEDEE